MPTASYRLQDYPELEKFLASEWAAVLAVPIDEQATIHAAGLMYWHSPSPLRFYFVTRRDSEKCQLIMKQKSVQAACVIGTIKDVAFTLQMRGQIQFVNPLDAPGVIEDYYQKRGNRHDDIDDPINVLLEFTPTWARFTDYSKGYDHYSLELT